MSTPIVRVRGLVHRYGDVEAVRGLDLEVQEGEIFGFLGPNGAGKSTTIKVLTTLLTPTAAEVVEVCGADVRRQPEAVRRQIGYVPQQIAVDVYLTARENLEMMAGLYGVPPAEARRRIDALLELVELREAADRPARTYSGGMRKRLDLAMGLIHRPRLLFLDEPTLGLDVQSRHRIWAYVRRLREEGVTVFLATNYLDEADQLCDRVAILDRGRIVALDTPQRLKGSLGGDSVLLELPTPHRNGLVEALAAVPGVREVREAPEGLAVFVEGAAQALPQLLEAAAARGVTVRAAHVRQPTLDDVFLRYTGRHLRDGEPAPPRGGRRRRPHP